MANAEPASTLKELLKTLATAATNQKKVHKNALTSAGQLEDAGEKAKATDDAIDFRNLRPLSSSAPTYRLT